MPEPRAWPRGLPRLGADLCVTFGKPLNFAELDLFRDAYAQGTVSQVPGVSAPDSHLYPETPATLQPNDAEAYAALRSRLAAYLRHKLAQLGEEVRIEHGLGPGEGQLVHNPRKMGTSYKEEVPV